MTTAIIQVKNEAPKGLVLRNGKFTYRCLKCGKNKYQCKNCK